MSGYYYTPTEARFLINAVFFNARIQIITGVNRIQKKARIKGFFWLTF
jgi:hypothetical protein